MMSLSEGFELSLIDGFHIGLPSMYFSDVDAFVVILNLLVMIAISKHTDEAVAAGLDELLTSQRNK